MTKRVQDKAVVSIEFPDKVYIGSFARNSKVEARAEDDGLLIKLVSAGEQKREVEMHLHHHVLADILAEWAESLVDDPPMQTDHRKTLKSALKRVEKALK
ncbi:MAG: hypothetical protein GY789_17325 [Hyphomicrobiales bacterium]|nr:hypothetical protein [Hyphomicrobiales bacterium]